MCRERAERQCGTRSISLYIVLCRHHVTCKQVTRHKLIYHRRREIRTERAQISKIELSSTRGAAGNGGDDGDGDGGIEGGSDKGIGGI